LKAYAGHHTLKLSVSDFLLFIDQGIANHVLENAEALRDKFVDHEGKLLIEVRRDNFVFGSDKNDWEGVVDEISGIIKKHIKTDFYDLFIDDSSIATKTTKTATEITLMAAFQKYFRYQATTLCGIPKFILKGAVDDWKNL